MAKTARIDDTGEIYDPRKIYNKWPRQPRSMAKSSGVPKMTIPDTGEIKKLDYGTCPVCGGPARKWAKKPGSRFRQTMVNCEDTHEENEKG